jgi:ankyrin repeat protein
LFGANINIENQWDLSAMHYACIGGYTRIVQLLISAGVPVSYVATTDRVIHSNARPYLHTAAQYGRHEIVEMIIHHETFLSSDLLALDCHGKNRIE